MRQLLLTAFLIALGASASAQRSLPPGSNEPPQDPDHPHIHLSLIPPPAMLLRGRGGFDKFAAEIAADGFLGSAGQSSGNLLSPCSLLAAAVVSDRINFVWWKILQGSVPAPPPGTNILGMYDNDLKDGRFPRDDLPKTADILARLFIWHSWGVNARANTLVRGSTQEWCLDTLVSDTSAAETRINVKLSAAEWTSEHHEAVSYFSATLPREDSERSLGELRASGLMSLSQKSTQNPLAPCSVLKAMRLASRINDLWGSISARKLRSSDAVEKRFPQGIRDGAIVKDDPVKTAQIAAYLFGSEIFASHLVTDVLTSESDQRECLNEIFQPGQIRSRLEREGKLPTRR